MIDISVVIPVYRNADTLVELHERLSRAIKPLGLEFELIFVNDACPAGSGRVLGELARDRRVCVIALDRNEGQHRAVRHGLETARGDILAVLDADLQDPPEAIPLLVAELGKGHAQAVFAGRRGEYQHASRMATSRAFKLLMRGICGVPVDAGSQVVMTRQVVERVLQFPVKQPYTLALIGSVGLPMTSIPVLRDRRLHGESAFSDWARIRLGWHGLRAALYLKWWKWTKRPSNCTMRRSEHTIARL